MGTDIHCAVERRNKADTDWELVDIMETYFYELLCPRNMFWALNNLIREDEAREFMMKKTLPSGTLSPVDDLSGKDIYVEITRKQSIIHPEDEFRYRVIPAMGRLHDDPEKVRLVFGFDS